MRNRKHDIERYLRGELSPAEMHALEREALNDPFLAEALEGIEQTGRDKFLYDLHEIKRSVRDRSRVKSRRNGKSVRMWGWTSAIAASVLLIAVSGFLVVSLLRDQAARQQAQIAEAEALLDTTSTKDTLSIVMPAERPVRKLKSDVLIVDNQNNTLARPGTARARRDISKRTDGIRDDDDSLHAEAVADKEAGHVVSAAESVEESEENAEKEESPAIVADLGSNADPVSRAAERQAGAVESKRTSGAGLERKEEFVIGKVVDSTGEPLPGVNVRIKGTNIGTVTNASGDFQLSLPAARPNVVFDFIGFETQEVEAVNPIINVTMKEDVTALSEVVVTGYGVEKGDQSNPTFRFAEPDGGKSVFRDYLNSAVQYPAEAVTSKTEGRVTVRFTVGANGQLSDFEVIKGIGSGCEDALIRAIKEGPAWKPSTRGDVPVPDKVRVRYKFELP